MQTFEKKFEHYKKTHLRTTNRYYQLKATDYYICTWSDVYKKSPHMLGSMWGDYYKL